MTTDELKALLDKARETFCLASPGSDEEFAAYLSGFDAASQIALSHCDALREREARLVEALRWMGAERNKQMRTADYHGDDCRCYRCAEDAVFAALAEIEKEAGE